MFWLHKKPRIHIVLGEATTFNIVVFFIIIAAVSSYFFFVNILEFYVSIN